jgi:hypothetical protein
MKESNEDETDTVHVDDRLTRGNMDDLIAQTFIGQAHIAGTGPEGTTCRECAFWHKWETIGVSPQGYEQRPVISGYFSKRHPDHPGQARPAFCNRPILNKERRLVPHYAKSCRLFKPVKNPMPITLEGRTK